MSQKEIKDLAMIHILMLNLAEMPEIKNKISHRAMALKKLELELNDILTDKK